ncbi:transporter substrate-binding domain-containing protein [Vibrio wakamikoensis]|uniref:ABC transporter substrate-binding protein n=1 Tax=Vibrio wakamikoensis TaxID=2910251 RepID=UPI003D224447
MKKLLLAILCGVLSLSSVAQPLRLAGKPDDDKLHLTLLKEIISRSEQYSSIDFIYAKSGEPAGTRLLADLESGTLDVVWTATNQDLETRFDAIPFPIYRGMLGMRIGLVSQERANKLASVNSVSDLKRLSLCSGKTWADTQILEANGLSIAKSLKYPNIFDMLVAGNRCDAFMRGVMEPWAEVKSHPNLPLEVDENVMLRYKMPYLLFVRKGNEELKQHLYDIMLEIHNEGLYETMFFADNEIKAALKQANLSERVVFDLDNPNVTAATKAIPDHFFFDPLAK